MDPEAKAGGCVVIVVVLIIIGIIGTCMDGEDFNYTTGKVQNSSFDASVEQVERYLKNHLKDPRSYQAIEWSSVTKRDDGSYYVRHKYRAKNSFGGYVVNEQLFYLDAKGNVTSVKDLY
jgi:hypothetical protein